MPAYPVCIIQLRKLCGLTCWWLNVTLLSLQQKKKLYKTKKKKDPREKNDRFKKTTNEEKLAKFF